MNDTLVSDITLNRPIICVVGARPNFMKMAPIMCALSSLADSPPSLLVHTGQHYDVEMNDQFFEALQLPSPNINLHVGSGSHAVQTAEVMIRFEKVVDECRPRCIIVVGDVNSTLACTLVAVKKNILVAHVEAGLRSYDRSMPEEINRKLTDQVADRLYTTEKKASENLLREGIEIERIKFVGNVMIDSIAANRSKIPGIREVLHRLPGISSNWAHNADNFGVVTLHRPSNVDEPAILEQLLETLNQVALRIPLIFAIHPRTREKIDQFGLKPKIDKNRVLLVPPQGYLEMLGLVAAAKVVLTDSGGLQEETTAMGIPCLTLRDNTERPITVEEGTNTLVGHNRELTLFKIKEILSGRSKIGCIPEFWDGAASKRIVGDLVAWLK